MQNKEDTRNTLLKPRRKERYMAISKLRLLRVKADMTQEELSRKSGMSRATVTRIESGNVGLMGASLGNLLKLTKTPEV